MNANPDSPNGRRTTVLVVGGGPVGLTMALLLHRAGIRFDVLEKGTSTTDHPKARGCDIRTMELFRQWGVDEGIKARGLPPGSDVFAVVDTIAGHEYGRTEPELNLGLSPAWRCLVSQDVVEEHLFAALQASPHGRVHFQRDFTAFREVDGGVTVSAVDLQTGEQETWHCDYLIGADGAGSPVRRQAGLEMRGPATLAVMANEYWKADLSGLPRISATAAYRIRPKTADESVWTVLNTNGRDRWLSAGWVGAERDERALPRTDAEVVALARRQTGLPDLEVQVINRSIWRLSRQVANRFRAGRVFLIGDAAHRFPPNGGFGMNSGIADAHNLAWKLRMVLAGQAGAGLLDSYDVERRPIAESNADFSLGNQRRFLLTDDALRSGNRDQIEFWIRDTENHLHSSGQSLGFGYEQGAIVPDGTVRQPLNSRYYTPSDRPGGRFPHFWLDLARTRSSLDWFDREFVLVAGPEGGAWIEAAKDVADRTGVALRTQRLDHPHEADGLALGLRGALLVRPDGHVAWRRPWKAPDPVGELGGALQHILSLEEVVA